MIPIYSARPDQVEKALKHVYHTAMNKTKGKELELLLAILPDNNGSLYGIIIYTSRNRKPFYLFEYGYDETKCFLLWQGILREYAKPSWV